MKNEELLSIREELKTLLKRVDDALSKPPDRNGNPIVVGKIYRHVSSGFLQTVTKIIDGNFVETKFLHNGRDCAADVQFLEPHEMTLDDVKEGEIYSHIDCTYLQYWKNDSGQVLCRNSCSNNIFLAIGEAKDYKLGERVGNIKDLKFI